VVVLALGSPPEATLFCRPRHGGDPWPRQSRAAAEAECRPPRPVPAQPRELSNRARKSKPPPCEPSYERLARLFNP
jgi:hypothetical protein